jgi:ABC-type multidrug transport system fused ATPase/permease subunit
MRDFPPTITAFPTGRADDSADRLVGQPDLRSPGSFLRWHLGQQRGVIMASTAVGILWQLPLTVGPWLVGRAIDDGILPGDTAATLAWSSWLLLVTVIGCVFGIAMHTLIVRSWLIALYGTTLMVARKVVQMGHVLPRRAPTGEVLSVASSDSDEFGALTEITARASAQLVAYLVVAGIVLSTSPRLGLMMLVAAPVLVGVALPLLRPLHRRQEVERSRNAELTSMATDIVGGLRILRGIGGERTFGRNYAAQSQRTRIAGVSAGIWQAGIEAIGVLFSGWFLVLLMWMGTREVQSGDLSIGQLISFLGYGLFMLGPIQTFFEFAQKLTRALVSARRAIGIFEQEPPWLEPETLLAPYPRSPPRWPTVSAATSPPTPNRLRWWARVASRAAPLAGNVPNESPSAPGSRPRTATVPAARGESGSARWIWVRSASRTYVAASWSATPAASCSAARCRTPSTRTTA